ncbi:hypothetical protein IT412_04685 [Candidatus Peregrinibacteria bacterium]|nr:hypothetical protein [Candidatus Peregrinibacteria bacterium]
MPLSIDVVISFKGKVFGIKIKMKKIIQIGVLFLVLLVTAFSLYYVFLTEKDGIASKYDCEEVVNIKDNFFDRGFNSFLCDYDKNSEQQIYRGTCVRREYAQYGKCRRVYVYEKAPQLNCENGNIGVYGDCQCSYGYKRENGKCEQVICPDNSYMVGTDCSCNFGYKMNGKKCEQIMCGENAHVNSYQSCECDLNYEKNILGVCQQKTCPENSRLIAGDCSCEVGFEKKMGKCEKIVCGKNKELVGNECSCLQGYSMFYDDECLKPQICGKNSTLSFYNTCECNDGSYFKGGKCIEEASLYVFPMDRSYSIDPIEMKGYTSGNCSKIVIKAANSSYSGGFEDTYQLKTYKYGDTTFNYGIDTDYNNLAMGSNTYLIKAYCDDDQEITKTVEFYYFGN